MTASSVQRAHDAARQALLDARTPGGYWVGRLSSSALATATAVSALSLVSRERFAGLIEGGARWLDADRNPDGGWGDSPESPSNVPTTLLVNAALRLAGQSAGGERYLAAHAGPDTASRIRTVLDFYGVDRTFAAPILANLALAGDVAWRDVPRLPFELACCPRSWFRALRLQVVSYALPALIAVGQLVHARRPGGNPLARLLRRAARTPTSRLLERIQPSSGGYLEAVPLTSFVTMSLAGLGRTDDPVVVGAVEFLRRTVRPDGGWPVDSNLSVWLTTMSVEALSPGGRHEGGWADELREWLVECRHRERHPYTAVEPGGWAWTHLPGGVPDVDDTAGALIALARLGQDPDSPAVRDGLRWLHRRQNTDGGWPTFCRGWGRLPFDRSAPDLTAHALRAIVAWQTDVAASVRPVRRGLDYLARTQRQDGSWAPLWFGNQRTPDGANPVYGTARVLAAYRDLGLLDRPEAARAVGFLLGAQNAGGGWGGGPGVESTMEETALAVMALHGSSEPGVADAVTRGAGRLAERVEQGDLSRPAPIGLYFAKLWYSEDLYPVVWTTAALGRVLEEA